jgi:ribosomal protein S12 methylthiotransferase
VLKAMKRPGNQEKTLERIAKWRGVAPDLAIRSTFVVGFPGETEDDFKFLLDWLEEAQLDRVGAFAYENVAGAQARDLPGHVPEEVKQDRRARFMAAAARISRAKLKKKVGRTLDALIDAIRPDGVAVGRTYADAPEIDGNVFITGGAGMRVGDKVKVRIDRAGDFDLHASPTDFRLRNAAPAGRMHRVISRF